MFHFMFIHYTFTFRSDLVAWWPPFWKKLPARLAICSNCILSICNIYLVPDLVLRAGFAFRLLQFLFIVFLLLLHTFSATIVVFRIQLLVPRLGKRITKTRFCNIRRLLQL